MDLRGNRLLLESCRFSVHDWLKVEVDYRIALDVHLPRCCRSREGHAQALSLGGMLLLQLQELVPRKTRLESLVSFTSSLLVLLLVRTLFVIYILPVDVVRLYYLSPLDRIFDGYGKD